MLQVWSLTTYQLLVAFPAHDEGVLGLHVSSDGLLLFSSGVDSVVNVSVCPSSIRRSDTDRYGPLLTFHVCTLFTPILK